MGSIVCILRAWGLPFLLLLDDDTAGRRARDAYAKDLLLTENEVATLGDLVPSLKGKALEGIFKKDVQEVANATGLSTGSKLSKSDYYLLFQALLQKQANAPKLTQTMGVARKLHQAIEARLSLQ